MTRRKPSAQTELPLALYRKMYLIRKSEERIRELYPENEMRTPMHMSLGGEAIAVGVCDALGPGDQVLGSYRSHGIYLARTGETDKFFAELYGRNDGMARGKAGSMHLSAPEQGLIGTSAIVASIIPVAVGAAFANKRQSNGKLVAAFFGDGAIDEGNFWESFNVACLMKLPILFVCEDNGFAVHTPASARHGYDSIADIAAKFRCHVLQKDTTDVEVIYKLTRRGIGLIKTSQMPCFMYLKYYRYLEHVGVNEDFNAGYRARTEFEEWYQRDPVSLQRKKLLNYGVTEADLTSIEWEVDTRIETSVARAKAAAFAPAEELDREVFCDQH